MKSQQPSNDVVVGENVPVVKTLSATQFLQSAPLMTLTLMLRLEEIGIISREDRMTIIEDSSDLLDATLIQVPSYLTK